MKKVIALILSILVIFSAVVIPASAQTGEIDYTIENPYAGIDFSTWKGYKTQLHCHTTASDGYMTIKEAIDGYYALDYDIVAITDHGTTNRGWDKAPQTIPIMREIKKERSGGAKNPIIPLSMEEYTGYINGTRQSSVYSYEKDGSRISTERSRTHSNGLLDVPQGNELNMATPVCDCHLTGYFSDYGQGLAGVYGDYETPASKVAEDGGITMLSHVGEYVYPDKDSADHVGKKVDEYFVNKFARIFLDNPKSSVGMGINSATDVHTRCDRILYDQILQKTIPNGVTPWGFCFSDSHNETSINDAYSILWMPKLTNEAFRDCMVNGQFFAVSHYSNGYELNGMKEMENYKEDSDVEWWKDNTPRVNKVEVDEENDIIKVWGENFSYITWVSDGNVVLREYDCENGYAELSLRSTELLDDINMFVRFYIVGENGICYSQPMVVRKNGESFAPVNVPKTYDLPWFLRGLVTVLDIAIFKLSPIVWIFKYFALGYNPLEQIFKF